MDEPSTELLLEQILNLALSVHASDIHLHLDREGLDIIFRAGGELVPYGRFHDDGPSLVRRAKALAKMDVTDLRVPQDGSFFCMTELGPCDVRVAAIPTIQGESLVLRLLPRSDNFLEFTDLGMTPEQAEEMDELLEASSGLILVAGATGTGKTTTLYAMMHRLSTRGRNVVSIEDPVEAQLACCRQMEVRERVGITFDVGLRAILRQDPDVIMIGEVRDEETARVAVRAALTGHLVLTTTHAKGLLGAASRLVDFGISRMVLSDVLLAVVIQELHVEVCQKCQGQGCTGCEHTGRGMKRCANFVIQSHHQHRSLMLQQKPRAPSVRRGLPQVARRGQPKTYRLHAT